MSGGEEEEGRGAVRKKRTIISSRCCWRTGAPGPDLPSSQTPPIHLLEKKELQSSNQTRAINLWEKINDRRKDSKSGPSNPSSEKNGWGKKLHNQGRPHIRPKQFIYPLLILNKTCTFPYFSVSCNLLLSFLFQTYICTMQQRLKRWIGHHGKD